MSLTILNTSMLAINVCTDARTKTDIEEQVNAEYPAGTSQGWAIDEQESRRLNQSMVECSEKKGFRHWILYC